MKRTIVVGDVHGCVDEAQQLLKACALEPGDAVVFVGDLVGRGPDSKGAIALARSIDARSVLGNHEYAWLAWKRSMETGGPLPPLGGTQPRALMELDDGDWNLLRSLPLWIRLPEFRVIVVHAGLIPGIPLEKQRPQVLLNIRTVRDDGGYSEKPFEGAPWGSCWRGPAVRDDGGYSEKPFEGAPWGSCWRGPDHVIFGHHARRGLQRHPFATGIDMGCVYGGHLAACILPGHELVSVKAKRAYRRPRS